MTIQSQYWYQVPTTGFSLTIPNWADKVILNPAGLLTSGTLILPVYPCSGQRIAIFCTQIVTTLTMSATSATLVGALTTLAANVIGGRWEFCLETQTWYPV